MNKVLMPKMGDTMEEGKILNWIKKEGDTVNKGDALAEVETDKVNIEVEAFVSGVLRKILIPVGQSAPVGAEIALVGDASEPLEQAAPKAPAQASAPARASAPASPAAAPVREAPRVSGAEAQVLGNGRAATAPTPGPQPQPVAGARSSAVEGERIFIS